MISREFADQQLERLCGLRYFPAEPAAIKELAFALMVAENDSCALSAIAKVLEDFSDAPTPAELRMLAYSANAAISQTRRDAEIQQWKKEVHVPDYREDRELMAEHKRVLLARMAELRANPALDRIGKDGRKVHTPLRDRLDELAFKLTGKTWQKRCEEYTDYRRPHREENA